MNVGIDLDQTITELPEFFAIVSAALRQAGHRMHIVSYRHESDLADTRIELAELGVQHDGVHLSGQNEGLTAFKARMARELDFDLFIDDMPEALVDLPEKTQRLWLCDPAVYNLRAVIRALSTEGLQSK
ncbi:MAG: hypothetical protein JJU36_09890 [Phycisphaeraceae bacterium]|nr:hypothetical protein [Phycisphaeraceae bacterium]